jgi:hypothetical protein
MQVFISWSGPTSHGLARSLRDWLPDVIQAVKPWVSSEDIQKGTVWSSELTSQLAQVRFGVLCVTPDNVGSPWMAFEAGAMTASQVIGRQRVAPVLLGMKKGQVTGPLSLFQLTEPVQSDVWLLVLAINESMGDVALSEERLRRTFERMWPALEKQIEVLHRQLDDQPTEGAMARSDSDMLDELVQAQRAQSRHLETIQAQLIDVRAQQSEMATRNLTWPVLTREQLESVGIATRTQLTETVQPETVHSAAAAAREFERVEARRQKRKS